MQIRDRIVELRRVPASQLAPNPRNWRTHPKAQADALRGVLSEIGIAGAVLARKRDDGVLELIDGHLRAETLGDGEVPVLVLDVDEAEALKLLATYDPLSAMAEADSAKLDEILRELETNNEALKEMLSALAREAAESDEQSNPTLKAAESSGKLAERFGVPPFTVLNARSGWWQERKQAWSELGIESELGRDDALLWAAPGGTKVQRVHAIPEGGEVWRAVRESLRKAIKRSGLTHAQVDEHCGTVGMVGHWIGNSQPSLPTPEKWSQLKQLLPALSDQWDAQMMEVEEVPCDFNGSAQRIHEITGTGTSLFDPVLCELVYNWFSPVGGTVLDPFAGGSVRGIVASRLGRRYHGIELRREQVEANQRQENMAGDPKPSWIAGDSRDLARLCPDVEADLVFSCPPYTHLERYSDDPADLSTLDYPQFLDAYRLIIDHACAKMKQDRFACFVVGEVRDKHGRYYNFVGDTVEAFRAAGLHYYNEAILVTAIGSLPIRIGKQFATGRKLGKTHQNVLVFVKGDGKSAAEACGECVFGAVDDAERFGEVLE